MKQVKTEEFDELIKGEKPVVCDFFATWCGPCKMLAPVMDKASELYGEKAEFVRVDVDEEPELAQRYGIMSIPTVIVFAGGEEKDKSVGFMAQSEMNEFIERNV
ncbi:MAG: thioredoxin [Clostridia bacterium]|nr:thioredoxin [Clostridia bacterium]